MSHKVLEVIGDEVAERIAINQIGHSGSVTNGMLSSLTTLNKPTDGFEALAFFDWFTLDEKVSPTVIDQFTQHCRHLLRFSINGTELGTEADR